MAYHLLDRSRKYEIILLKMFHRNAYLECVDDLKIVIIIAIIIFLLHFREHSYVISFVSLNGFLEFEILSRICADSVSNDMPFSFAMDVIQQLHWVHIIFCDLFPSSPSEGIAASSTLKIFPTARDVDSTL